MTKISSLASRLMQSFTKAPVESAALAAKRKHRWAGLDMLEDRKMLAADLSGVAVNFSAATFTPGATAYATVFYQNSGDATAGPHTVKLYRSQASDGTGLAQLLASTVVQSLTAGGSKSVPFSWTATVADADGDGNNSGSSSGYLVAVIDEDASVVENSDANNFDATAAADYTVTVPVISVLAASASGSDLTAVEGTANSGKFVLSRTGSTVLPLTVTVAYTGTATYGTDYTVSNNSSTTVTFKANSSTASVTLSPVVDTNTTASESAPETVILTVVASPAAVDEYTGAGATQTMNITDTVPALSVAWTDSLISEKQSNPGNLRLSRTGNTSQAVVATIDFSSGSAVGVTDFVASVAGSALTFAAEVVTVTIPANRTFVDIKVTPVDDVTPESTETIIATIQAAGANNTYTIGTNNASANLLDNDTLNLTALVSAASQTFTAPTTSGNKTLRFSITITNTSATATVPTTLQVGLLAGAATSGNYDSSLIALQTISIGSVKAGGVMVKNFSIRLSSVSAIAAGTYRAAAKVDAGLAITESNETDNYGFSGAVITVA